MKERGMLFSGPMVQALLAGRKTVTRRLVKPIKMHSDAGSPLWDEAWIDDSYMDPKFGGLPCLKVPFDGGIEGRTVQRHFPDWEPGDRLWVRETWQRIESGTKAGQFAYLADNPSARGLGFMPWNPSIFMPRAACRILLPVVSVRVERLHEMTMFDMDLEGVPFDATRGLDGDTSRLAYFRELWDKINPKHPWESNPWVWRIEFERPTRAEALSEMGLLAENDL